MSPENPPIQPLAAEPEGVARFRTAVEPILAKHCVGCHGAGSNKGNVNFDRLESGTAFLEDRDLWWKALKMVQAGLTPPRPPTSKQRTALGCPPADMPSRCPV